MLQPISSTINPLLLHMNEAVTCQNTRYFNNWLATSTKIHWSLDNNPCRKHLEDCRLPLYMLPCWSTSGDSVSDDQHVRPVVAVVTLNCLHRFSLRSSHCAPSYRRTLYHSCFFFSNYGFPYKWISFSQLKGNSLSIPLSITQTNAASADNPHAMTSTSPCIVLVLARYAWYVVYAIGSRKHQCLWPSAINRIPQFW